MIENFKVSVSVLPFGQMKLMFSSSNKEKIESIEMPVYKEPYSTSIERIEILYEDHAGYKVPETTDGK